MVRTLALCLVATIMCHGSADAQSTRRGSGQYVQTQPRDKAKVKKIEALTLKQSNARKGRGNVKWQNIELKRGVD